MSTSDRRSGSSEPSKKRRNVYISSTPRGRAADTGDAKAKPRSNPHARVPAVPASASGARAQERKAQREVRLSARRRVRGIRVTAAVAAVVVVLVSCIGLYSSPLFAIRTVEVIGVKHVSVATVLRLAHVPTGATLIRFPADAVAARVSADPWVESVSVSRVFPSGMRIRVVERDPIAVVDTGASLMLIDRSGVVIAAASEESSAAVPTIVDVPGLDLKPGRRTTSEPLLNAIKLLTGLSPQLAGTARTISAPTIDGTALVTVGRVEIVMGEAADLVTKDALARRILAEQRGKVVSIDVRVVDRPTWRGLK